MTSTVLSRAADGTSTMSARGSASWAQACPADARGLRAGGIDMNDRKPLTSGSNQQLRRAATTGGRTAVPHGQHEIAAVQDSVADDFVGPRLVVAGTAKNGGARGLREQVAVFGSRGYVGEVLLVLFDREGEHRRKPEAALDGDMRGDPVCAFRERGHECECRRLGGEEFRVLTMRRLYGRGDNLKALRDPHLHFGFGALQPIRSMADHGDGKGEARLRRMRAHRLRHDAQ